MATKHPGLSGAKDGLYAGIVLMLYFMAAAFFLGVGVLSPLYSAATPFLGSQTLQTSLEAGGFYLAPGALTIGIIAYLVLSALLGLAFGYLEQATKAKGGNAIALGVLYGVGVALIMAFLVLPFANTGGLISTLGWPVYLIGSIIFGLILGLDASRHPIEYGAQPAPQKHHHGAHA